MLHAAELFIFPEIFEKCSTGNVPFGPHVVFGAARGDGGRESEAGEKFPPLIAAKRQCSTWNIVNLSLVLSTF
jgi:hypothetical protein